MCVCCQQTMRDDGMQAQQGPRPKEAFVCTISAGAFVPGSAEIEEAKVQKGSISRRSFKNSRITKKCRNYTIGFQPTALAFLIFYHSSEHKVLKDHTKNSCNTGGGQQRMPTV